MRVSIFVQRSRKNLFLLSFDPGWIDCTCDHQICFFSETLFVRLISSSSIDALLILLHGCHAESFSNKQEQEVSYVAIILYHAVTTWFNENFQDLVNIFAFCCCFEMVCMSLIFRIGHRLADPILSGIDSCNVHQFLQRKPKYLSTTKPREKAWCLP